jgi:spermidine synthase/Flp pilus assembly protein TadD
MGLGISVLLPHLGQISGLVSSYERDPNGWYVLSTTSDLARAGIAIVLLTPITLLMGGTLTLLIRHLVGKDLDVGGWRIAVLYGVNTAGAALGCFLTDFALVPAWGLRGAQVIAALFNVMAAVGALWLAGSPTRHPRWRALAGALASRVTPVPVGSRLRASGVRPKTAPTAQSLQPKAHRQLVVGLTSLALALSGFAAMGMEILWFRHFTLLLGEFRAVFSLLLTVILIGIGAGSLVGGYLHRQTARLRSFELRRGSPDFALSSSVEVARPAQWLIVVQGLFVAATLLGLATADVRHIQAIVMANPAYQVAVGRVLQGTATPESGLARTVTELWFNARPILLEVGLPALLMGFAFPLGNAIIQRAERSVGRRAGVLYLSNTIGAVCGSLAAGFLLLPSWGIQNSATVLMIAAGLAVVPLYVASRLFHSSGLAGPHPRSLLLLGFARRSGRGRSTESLMAGAALTGSMLIAGTALGWWRLLPADYLITRALMLPIEKERVLAVSEGITEVIAVTEVPGNGRTLLTNGHAMSATAPLSQRYMRALAHIPLLAIDEPESVLVIGFGVGNTTHAATLHPSIRRVELVDLSRNVLAHAGYFQDANRDVLSDPRVVVYVNDGRQHLQMQPADSYDLITLEPPPIGYAGVAALYSREFYARARTRLKPKGYISQWLPVYQVPAATTLAMIRAFLEVFPHAVLLSGADAELLLMGANDSRIEIDPAKVAMALSRAPAVQSDLQRLDLGSVREIVGTFLASAQNLDNASRGSAPVTDDHPIQEYGVRSLLEVGDGAPAHVIDLSQVAVWCPTCFVDGRPVPLVEGLDTYLAVLGRAYAATPVEVGRIRSLANRGTREIEGSAYLGAIVPESADLHNTLGTALAVRGNFDGAIAQFREAVRLEPDSAAAHWNLGAALVSRGAIEEALDHLRRSVQLDPGNGRARFDLANTLLEVRRYDDAIEQLRAALPLMPDSVELHDSLGLALAWQGKVDDAIEQFRAALRVMPDSVKAHNNLGIALASQGKLDEAIDHFQQALTLDPEFTDARRNLTTALQRRR